MWKWVMNGVDTPYTVPTTLTPVVLKTPCHLLSNNEHTVVKKIINVFTTTWNCCYERRSTRVAEVAREHGWHPPKSLDSDENFKPEHMLFCGELRFVAICALFGDLWAKKVPFWVKNSISWARSALLHGIYCISYWVKFANLRLRAKTTHLSRKL